MSVKTVEKRRKRSWPLYLILLKGRCKAWITSDEAQFHLSFTTGQTKIQYISRRKPRKDAAVLQNTIWSSGVMAKSSQGLTKPFFVEPNVKSGAKYHQNKVLKHLIKESKRPYTHGNVFFHQDSALSRTVKSGLASNLGEGMDVSKCIVPLRHGDTLNSPRAANPLVSESLIAPGVELTIHNNTGHKLTKRLPSPLVGVKVLWFVWCHGRSYRRINDSGSPTYVSEKMGNFKGAQKGAP
ncbi:uncharacterized protein TNCV_2426421 [Trichonephila clavipes]|nr:uncharacterized protein TNCV_2426421 [Trichonephila clavipes]